MNDHGFHEIFLDLDHQLIQISQIDVTKDPMEVSIFQLLTRFDQSVDLLLSHI